jgi:hypothetical protein
MKLEQTSKTDNWFSEPKDVYEAFDLIKDELVHILSVTWNWNR